MKSIILAAVAILSGTAASAETYAIQAGRLIVDASKPARGLSTVVVENGRIARIFPKVKVEGHALAVADAISTLE